MMKMRKRILDEDKIDMMIVLIPRNLLIQAGCKLARGSLWDQYKREMSAVGVAHRQSHWTEER